jgi:UPF0755 protein
MIARTAPALPGAGEIPRRVVDLALARGNAPALHSGDELADARLGGATRAENDLDGPAEDGPGQQPTRGGRRTVAQGGDLDGPAPAVEDTPLAYSPTTPTNLAPNGKPRILDASEGTALDPLRDKSWDLNSPKTVDPKMLKGLSNLGGN